MGDAEHKRKCYCLMCNAFRPYRCHHCSTCNRCILNFDHHCPWVNNCIGFWNRKYFMLLLLYGMGVLVFYLFAMLGTVAQTVRWFMEKYTEMHGIEGAELICNIGIDCMYIVAVIVTVMLIRFTIFHIDLVAKNVTTIEVFEHEGKSYDNQVLFPKMR
eukprot:TRINITY_DN5615_c0_g2_i25.p1 TRINITY_DN5615_c0_g2~~TRINITY_DN5615_c0_g2_i25.p1  ORF type:complete len:158 (+),score=27.73 TRINITY_DN5615_c0_g2_i25:331-804(+)